MEELDITQVDDREPSVFEKVADTASMLAALGLLALLVPLMIVIIGIMKLCDKFYGRD